MQELTRKATFENITRVMAFVDAQLEAFGCSTKVQRLIDIAIDELFSNIVHYGYAAQEGMATVRVETQPDLRTVTIAFIDSGIPFNPLSHEDPSSSLAVKERKAGGFGISIVKKSMDNVRYEYVDGCNVTTITKKCQ